MNHNVTQGVQSLLGRIVRHVAALAADCNYAQTRMNSLRNTPPRF